MANRGLTPAPGGRLVSAPYRRLPALGSNGPGSALDPYRSLLGSYRSRSALAPCRSRSAVAPCRSRSAVAPCRSRSAVAPYRSRSALNLCRLSSTVGPSRSPAALNPNWSRSTLNPCGSRAALDPYPPLPALRRRVPAPRAGRHAVGGERDRGLVEGPLHHAAVGARGEGHDEGVGRAVAAQRRLGVQGRFDAVTVPMPQCRCAPPFLGAGEGEPGRPGSSLTEEQIRRGAPYDLRSSVAQQSSSALAPPCDHAVQAEGDRRDIG
ncbi:hypothetical protein [Streptomyces canus]|uniref:hypothetical protein n=1 Tax=Streptomyces canus TaxID=58343 RepID=UPI0022588270|nr:hypothetical protein [Streptomyces canus]MCX4852615.1 hypothetical protein [Streptomyces canus]